MKISEFERIVDKTFWGLTNKHDFIKTETSLHKRGANVSFQNPTTEVILNYEIGTFPWITIADIENPETDRVSLDWLLVELGEAKSPTTDEAFFSAKMDEGQLEEELQKRVCDRYGFEPKEHRLGIRGYCKNCGTKNNMPEE